MMRTKLLTGLVIILVLLNTGLLSFIWLNYPDKASHKRAARQKAAPRIENYLNERLNLSEEQAAAFSHNRRIHFSKTKKVMGEIRKKKKQAADMLAQGADSLKIEATLLDINKKTNELERLNFWHIKKLRDICNPGQQKKFDRIFHNMNDHSFRNRSKRMNQD